MVVLSGKDKEEICRVIVEMAEIVYNHVPKMIIGPIDREYLHRRCLELWNLKEVDEEVVE